MEPSMVERLLLSIDEGAELIGTSGKTLRRHIAAGDIRYVLIGKRTKKLTRPDIEEFIDKRRRGGCLSIDRKNPRTTSTTSSGKVVGFTARRERKTDPQRET